MARPRHNTGQNPLNQGALRRILCAPDSFKGSLTADEVADAMEAGVRDVLPGASVEKHPVSDGGEGLVSILTPRLGGVVRETAVAGPCQGQVVAARWGYCAERRTAVLEMAEAAGLMLVHVSERDPRVTTTFGVGQLMHAALDAGATTLIVGIGGSATNDGGAGMAEALGVRFLDERGIAIRRGGIGLRDLATIDVSGLDRRLKDVHLIVACDVRNVLLGPEGASAVFGPQKGASPEAVRELDEALSHYARTIERTLGIDAASVPGAGAAGGLGAGLLAFCGASLLRGIDVVLDATGFDARLAAADLVITGEGRIDRQLQYGKALSGVLERGKKAGKPVCAVVGALVGEIGEYTGPDGFREIEPLVNRTTPPGTAIANAYPLVRLRTIEMLQRVVSEGHRQE